MWRLSYYQKRITPGLHMTRAVRFVVLTLPVVMDQHGWGGAHWLGAGAMYYDRLLV